MKTPIPYEKIKEIILSYNNKNNLVTIRTRAMLAFQYVLACRVGELIPYYHKPNSKIQRDGFFTGGLTKSNIREYPNYWEIVIPNFKQKKGSTEPHYKTGFIIKNSKEDWLKETCFAWLTIAKEETVFPIKQSRARQLISEALEQLGIDTVASKKRLYGFSTHHLRDSRADHLLKIFDFNILDVQKTLGHKNLNSTQQYIDSNIKERVEKLQKAISNK